MNEVIELAVDGDPGPDLRSPAFDPLVDLRATPQLIARIVTNMRQRMRAAEDDPALSTDAKAERVGAARMSAMAQIDRLEEAAVAARATLGQATIVTQTQENEVAAGFSRLHLAFAYVRHEVSGKGGQQTILPDWRRGAVIRL